MKSIAIVDDHQVFILGLKSLLSQCLNYSILLEAKKGHELTEKITFFKIKPQIVFLNLQIPFREAYLTVECLLRAYPDIDIIIMSSTLNEESVLKLIKLGIKGYLLKSSPNSEFITALDTVNNGGYYYPPFIAPYLVKYINNTVLANLNYSIKLNKRENEFLELCASELTYKEIADKMCVSPRTVDGYRDSLFEKLKVKSRVGLVLYAIKNNLVEV